MEGSIQYKRCFSNILICSFFEKEIKADDIITGYIDSENKTQTFRHMSAKRNIIFAKIVD
jgi:hypothetical protein